MRAGSSHHGSWRHSVRWFKVRPQWEWERLGDGGEKRYKEALKEVVLGESSTKAKRIKSRWV